MRNKLLFRAQLEVLSVEKLNTDTASVTVGWRGKVFVLPLESGAERRVCVGDAITVTVEMAQQWRERPGDMDQ